MDVIFGTYHDPAHDPAPPGIDEPCARTWLGLIAEPLGLPVRRR